MDWKEYFKGRPLTIERFIDDTSDHKPFLSEIASLGHKDKEMLEVGCGNGTHSIFISYFGHDVTSIDNNREVLNIAERNNSLFNGKVAFKEADAFNLPFEDNRFAICFSQGFFEHFNNHNIRDLLREQLRVSHVVIFSVPTCYFGNREFGNERLMSKQDWLNIMPEFNVEKTAYYYFRKGTPTEPSQIYFTLTK